jgi:immune inhibitor A
MSKRSVWSISILSAIVSFSVLFLAQAAGAVSASPHPVTQSQPDGSTVELHIRGDEHGAWTEDRRGFSVVRNRGWFVYADSDGRGGLAPTEEIVGRSDPAAAGLRRGLRPSRSSLHQERSSGAASSAAAVVTTGELANLVVLLRFANHVYRATPTPSEIDVLFNAEGGDPALAPTGSVRDAYQEYSYGQLSVESTVSVWVDLPESEAYYAAGQSGLTTRIHEAIRYALDALDADPSFDFASFDRNADGQIDAITFIHSGYGAEWGGTDSDGAYYSDRIWSHKWSIGSWQGSEGVRVSAYHISPGLWGTGGSSIGRIGVICHELGHFLGLPDLYDTDSSPGQGIGSYGLMANSWGFDGSQHYPPHPSPWSKAALGWITPTPIASGRHSLEQAEFSPTVYRIDEGYPTDEYLLVENRQPVGLDGDMPQGGLVIWHIDDRAAHNNEGYPAQGDFPENGRHYRVAVLQADGDYDMEMGYNRGDGFDVYHAGGASAIDESTLPNTDAYQYGVVVATGNAIREIGSAGPVMEFVYTSLAGGPDSDADGVVDFEDNCLELANPDQRDTNLDGFGNACDADYNNDGLVGIPDFKAMRRALGSFCGDLDYDEDLDASGDCGIGGNDFNLLRSAFGVPPGPSGLDCAGAAPCSIE